VIHALFKETGERYQGILYGSFIATEKGVGVIEFNARFGDPEALNVLSILKTDFIAICNAIAKEKLEQLPIKFANLATVCKYSVPVGYPDQPKRIFL
jgi:phosphoribosylamine--glycine ligase